MADGNGIVYLGIVLALVGIMVSVIRLATEDDRLTRWARMTTVALFLVITSMMLFMYYLFITTDVSYEYVWTYTARGTSLEYRISGTLAGMAGSLMFWLWMIIIPWTVVEFRAMRRPVDAAVLDWTRIGTFATIMVFLYVLGLYEPFGATPTRYLMIMPDGQGLNALLQTDLMAIHPPIVFVAYGFMVIPFAAAMSHLITGHRDWLKLSLLWSRAGWLFLTMGIAIGALWAYTVLGWGGYWGWDPVETSSLLPWFLLTGFLHAQMMNRRKGDYAILAPLMGVLSYVLVVFATFSTRAAGLWVSVHAFPGDTSKPAWERFTSIVAENPSIRVYLAFMVIATTVTIVLALRTYYRNREDGEDGEEEDRYLTLAELIDDDMLMFTTITIFSLTTVVTLLILVGGVNGLTADNFNTPVGTLALVGTLLLLMCLVWRDLGRKRVVQLAGIALLIALVGAAVFDNVAVAVSMPILLVGLLGTGYKVVKSFDAKRAVPSLVQVGAHLIHLSVVLILIGYVGSTFLAEEKVLHLVVDGPAEEFAGYRFRATDIDTTPEHAFVDVEVWKEDRFLDKARPGAVLIQGQVRSEIAVVNTAFEDVYLVYHNISSTMGSPTANIEVKILPLMNVLWMGMVLMVAGISLRMVAGPLARRRRGMADGRDLPSRKVPPREMEEEEEEPEPGPPGDEEAEEGEGDDGDEGEELDDSYYEDLLEEELKRI